MDELAFKKNFFDLPSANVHSILTVTGQSDAPYRLQERTTVPGGSPK